MSGDCGARERDDGSAWAEIRGQTRSFRVDDASRGQTSPQSANRRRGVYGQAASGQ